MEQANRDFKGVWIPKEIWESKELSLMEKVFFVEIDSLDNEHGCYASNRYFSEFFNVSKMRCSQIIKSLEKKELVTVKLIYEGKQIKQRVIRVLNKFNRGVLNHQFNRYKENFIGYKENFKDNNTVNNTKEKEKTPPIIPLKGDGVGASSQTSQKKDDIPYQEIVNDLNSKLNKDYQHTTPKTRELIRARWKEGFRLEHFLKVHDIKIQDWVTDPERCKYLRPDTLYSTKFEGYLNQVSPKEVDTNEYETWDKETYDQWVSEGKKVKMIDKPWN